MNLLSKQTRGEKVAFHESVALAGMIDIQPTGSVHILVLNMY